MNRYAALGLALEADQGKRILVITPRHAANQHALDEFEQLPAELVQDARITRTNGTERITFPSGGAIIIRSAQSNLRGYAAHTVFLDEDTDARLTPTNRMDLALALNGTGGDIVRA